MKVAILGSGESAIGAALLADKLNYEVFVSDANSIKNEIKQLLENKNIRFEESGHTIEIIGEADCVVKSPGIPNKSHLITTLRKQHVEVIGEVEFGYQYAQQGSKIIAITGSNGKSTVTNMIYQMLQNAVKQVQIGGNFGKSFCRLLAEQERADYYVLELSSFQLEDIVSFRPHISILLNMTPDHLDRYEYSIDAYANAKARIWMNQTSDDTVIYNADDTIVNRLVDTSVAKQVAVPFHESGKMLRRLLGGVTVPFRGLHNDFNAMICYNVGKQCGLGDTTIIKALSEYKGLAHRMEVVAKVNGVTYINDSKATNVDAVYYALAGLNGPLVWIVGGVDKGNDYKMLQAYVDDKVKAIVYMGVDNQALRRQYDGLAIEVRDTDSLDAAMSAAVELSEEGDTVLLSPACASFDLFNNYIDRGNKFKKYIYNLIYTNR